MYPVFFELVVVGIVWRTPEGLDLSHILKYGVAS